MYYYDKEFEIMINKVAYLEYFLDLPAKTLHGEIISENVKNLLFRLFVKDPKGRLGSDQVKDHKAFDDCRAEFENMSKLENKVIPFTDDPTILLTANKTTSSVGEGNLNTEEVVSVIKTIQMTTNMVGTLRFGTVDETIEENSMENSLDNSLDNSIDENI